MALRDFVFKRPNKPKSTLTPVEKRKFVVEQNQIMDGHMRNGPEQHSNDSNIDTDFTKLQTIAAVTLQDTNTEQVELMK